MTLDDALDLELFEEKIMGSLQLHLQASNWLASLREAEDLGYHGVLIWRRAYAHWKDLQLERGLDV